MGDRDRGLYRKFHVERVDGKQEAHANCDYFVLDLTHDPHAVVALEAYTESARRDGYNLLANDLDEKVKAHS
jgi:hypothetical protein